MFTGLIQAQANVVSVTPLNDGSRLSLTRPWNTTVAGESISVDGVCLTLLPPTESTQTMEFDISPETLAKSTLGAVSIGQALNLERALKLGDPLGGHWVTGHVDGVATVEGVWSEGDFMRAHVTGLSSPQMEWVIPKGSICLNGVSLTLNEVFPNGFSVMLVPHTLEHTNLSGLTSGTRVNIEFDWMVKTVLRDAGYRRDIGKREPKLREMNV